MGMPPCVHLHSTVPKDMNKNPTHGNFNDYYISVMGLPQWRNCLKITAIWPRCPAIFAVILRYSGFM
jgi:hypothetical protein